MTLSINFIELDRPEANFNGEWFVRSFNTNSRGYYEYLCTTCYDTAPWNVPKEYITFKDEYSAYVAIKSYYNSHLERFPYDIELKWLENNSQLKMCLDINKPTTIQSEEMKF